jgi:hypothetical protein
VLPSTAVAMAWSRLQRKDHSVLEALLQLPVTVVDDLTAARARAVGGVGGEQVDAHALLCARDRGWPLLTADPDRYHGIGLAGVEIERLP